jgi:1,2-diacylglycerol 3-alpha-glucosyltransferase
VRTLARFVWEQFSAADVEPARRALDVVYSLTASERARYARMGIESPRVHWGIHPELLAYARDPALTPAAGGAGSERESETATRAGLRLFYPAGFLSRRKPVKEVLRAFRRVDGEASLVIKGQVERKLALLERAAARDPRVQVVLEDLPIDDHMARFAAADVCLAPSRWEGLGLHLYESMALGLPVITNDNPPMNELIRDGDNGLLVPARRRGRARSGIPAYAPSVRGLAAAIDRTRDPGVLDELRAGVERARAELSWDRTVADYAALLSRLG